MLLIMRIGTWNREGKWSDRHARFMHRQDCDVWSLTVTTQICTAGANSWRSAGQVLGTSRYRFFDQSPTALSLGR
jgi:hypothetical protein